MVQIKQKKGKGVKNPSPRSFSGGKMCPSLIHHLFFIYSSIHHSFIVYDKHIVHLRFVYASFTHQLLSTSIIVHLLPPACSSPKPTCCNLICSIHHLIFIYSFWCFTRESFLVHVCFILIIYRSFIVHGCCLLVPLRFPVVFIYSLIDLSIIFYSFIIHGCRLLLPLRVLVVFMYYDLFIIWSSFLD